MTSIERTAYPRLKRYFTPLELAKFYTPTSSETKIALANTSGQDNYFNLIILLKTFQRLGYFPKLSEIPTQLVEHIRHSLNLPDKIKLGYDQNRTLYRHKKVIRSYLNVTSFEKEARHLITLTIYQSAYVMDNPADLINVALEVLVKEHFELPGFYTLDKLVSRLRYLVNQKLFLQIVEQLNPEFIQQLDDLLEINSVEGFSLFNNLKKLPKKSTRNHLNDLLVHYSWLKTLGDISPYFKLINHSKIKNWGAIAKSLDASELKNITQPKRAVFLLCLINASQVQTCDNLVIMFLKQMQKIHHQAKEELQIIRNKLQEKIETVVSIFSDVLQVLSDESMETQLMTQIYDILKENGGVEHLLNECDTINAYKENNYLPLLWRFYKSHRSTFFRLISALHFESSSTDQDLIKALQFLKNNIHRRGKWLPNEVDLSWASSQWQKLMLISEKDSFKLSRRHFEVCLFSHLADELKSGDVYVIGSEDYADYREQLLPWEDCKPLMVKYCHNLGFPLDVNDFISHLKSWLEESALSVDKGYPSNTQVIISEQDKPILKRIPKKTDKASLRVLETLIQERISEKSLIDILRNVDYWTNFTRHFNPLSGSEPKLERATERYLLTLFTYGCNLGPTQAARHMDSTITPHMLSFVHRRHISLDKLNAALVDIINRYNVLELPKFWGKGISAAVDGTKYDLYEQNLISEYHIRYGGYGGIAYHHIADSYVALFSHFIPCGTWEAVYIIDGLLQNKSDIQPDTIHGDTQAQSTPVFALSYLLGIKLMPRIRNWQDLTFYRPAKETVYQHIDSLFKDSIDWDLIRLHWQDLFQVVLSIYTGKISSATLLRKLGNYSRKNRLYKAFQELGRVIRTVFLLQYISDSQLRQQIIAATNKVESYNGFSKWFFFGGNAIIPYNDPEEQEKVIKYNGLIANAVIFHNAVDLTEILSLLQRDGYLLDKEDIAALSPYLTQHIKRFGDYVIDMETLPRALDEIMSLVF